jgi:branched-chain amino acid transport system ATP-binding protein
VIGAPALQARDITVRYGEALAVRGVDLTVGRGEVVCLVGRNGAGKSSLMLALAGLNDHTGDVVVEGGPPLRHSPRDRARAGIVLVPEGRELFPDMTVEDNLLLGAYVRDRQLRRIRGSAVLASVLELFPALASRRGEAAGLLSGGQQQMLAIGRAMMSGPRILMIDEPTLGLAPKVAAELYEQLGELRAGGLSIVLAEESPQRGLRIADTCTVLSRGRATYSGAATTVRDVDVLQSLYFTPEAASAPQRS